MRTRIGLIGIALLLQITQISFAASVVKIKGNRALLNLEGESAREGEEFFALNLEGKRKGLIRINKVRGDKALGTIFKGKAETGWLLSRRVGPGGAAVTSTGDAASSTSSENSFSSSANEMYWGVVGGFGSQSISVDLGAPDDKTVDHTGTGINLSGLIDAPIRGNFWFRGLGGFQQYSLTSGENATLCGTGECKIEINYLAFDLWGRYIFNPGHYQMWAGAGFGLYFSIGDDSTTIEANSTAQTILFGAGIDIYSSEKMSIPIQIDYSMFTNQEAVKASSINLKGGVAFKY